MQPTVLKESTTKAYLLPSALKPFSFFVKHFLGRPGKSFVKTEKDYEEFLELLTKHDVKYCIVGAFALAFHAEPRYTKDIDILIEASTNNAEKLLHQPKSKDEDLLRRGTHHLSQAFKGFVASGYIAVNTTS